MGAKAERNHTSLRMSRESQAIALRDHLLPLIRAYGQPEEYRAGGALLSATRWSLGNGWMFLIWSPRIGRDVAGEALDIWHNGHKAMALQWSDDGTVDLISMQPGVWRQAAMLIEGPSP